MLERTADSASASTPPVKPLHTLERALSFTAWPTPGQCFALLPPVFEVSPFLRPLSAGVRSTLAYGPSAGAAAVCCAHVKSPRSVLHVDMRSSHLHGEPCCPLVLLPLTRIPLAPRGRFPGYTAEPAAALLKAMLGTPGPLGQTTGIQA